MTVSATCSAATKWRCFCCGAASSRVCCAAAVEFADAICWFWSLKGPSHEPSRCAWPHSVHPLHTIRPSTVCAPTLIPRAWSTLATVCATHTEPPCVAASVCGTQASVCGTASRCVEAHIQPAVAHAHAPHLHPFAFRLRSTRVDTHSLSVPHTFTQRVWNVEPVCVSRTLCSHVAHPWSTRVERTLC